MPPITALNTHPYRKGRLRVEIDGTYAFELSRKAILAHHVVEKEQLSAERLHELQFVAAREAAISLLARRERSRAELVTALGRKSFPKPVIETVLTKLQDEGMQSDTRFAESWVNTRRRIAPRGRAALRYELHQKGITETAVNHAVEQFSRDEEREALRELIDARLQRMADPKADRAKIKNRLLGLLARRGFAYDDIAAVLREHFPDWA